MSLRLETPKAGRTSNYRIRGTYLGHAVDESAKTADKKLAAKRLQQIRAEIERGEFANRSGPTFLDAAVSYLEAGGDGRFVGRHDPDTGEWSGLIAHFGETPLARIDQAAIDAAASALFPNASPATRNRQCYTPVSAILRHAGVRLGLRRPKGANGKERLDWLTKEQAFAILGATDDLEWRLFLMTLLFTGLRLGEATVGLRCDRMSLTEGWAHVSETKNGDPREVYLPPALVAELANHPRGLDRSGETVFKFRKNGALYTKLNETFAAAGVPLPGRVAFHLFRHTWASWMRRYGGADAKGLLATGAWRDSKSASRYMHVSPHEEAKRADMLPAPPKRAKHV